jgi:hypothetical protein
MPGSCSDVPLACVNFELVSSLVGFTWTLRAKGARTLLNGWAM